MTVALLTLQATIVLHAAEAPAKFKVGEFNFKPPKDWQWVETTSSMRKAQLKVGKEPATAEVIFFHFGPGGGGDVQANVDRWLGQFQEPKDQIHSKVEKNELGGKQVTFVQAEGTYLSGQPGGPKTPQPGSMLAGAILDSKEGNVFIRMVGPKAVVEQAQPAFRKMIEEASR